MNDVESWTYNLTAANQDDTPDPVWYRQSSLREAFNLKDLLPSTLRSFATDLSRNTTAFQQVRTRGKFSVKGQRILGTINAVRTLSVFASSIFFVFFNFNCSFGRCVSVIATSSFARDVQSRVARKFFARFWSQTTTESTAVRRRLRPDVAEAGRQSKQMGKLSDCFSLVVISKFLFHESLFKYKFFSSFSRDRKEALLTFCFHVVRQATM